LLRRPQPAEGAPATGPAARPARLLLADSLPVVGLALAVVLWGTSFVATKAALTGFGPLVVGAGRMIISSTLMLALWPRVPDPDRRPGDWRWLALIALLYPGLYYVLEGNALTLTTASQAGTVSALVPLLAAAGARIFLSEHLARRAVAGLVASLAGVAVLSLGAPTQDSAPAPALGNALEVVAMVGYAISMLALKRLTARYNPWFLTGMQFLVGAVLFLPAVILTPLETWGHAPAEAWAGLIYLGLLVTLLPAGLYNFAMSRMATGRAALAINLVPVVALVTGFLLLGDKLAPIQVVACAVIFGGVMLGQLPGRSRAAQTEAADDIAGCIPGVETT
jgi:drug/metabolite transporter (DMT)-like permease